MSNNNFGHRLKAAMFAAGITSPALLARRCGVSRQSVEKWMKASKPRLSATHLLGLANCLHVRMRWLMTGDGIIPDWELHERDVDIDQAIRILDRLSQSKARDWLAAGRRLGGSTSRSPRAGTGGKWAQIGQYRSYAARSQ